MKTLNLQTNPFIIPQKLNKLLRLCFFMSLIFMSFSASSQNSASADTEPVAPILTQIDCIDVSLIDPNANCPVNYEPVCGCNNITYKNECVAKSNGVTSYIKGVCPCDVSIKEISRESTCDGYNICVEIIGGVAPYKLVFGSNTIITNPEESIYCFSELDAGNHTVKIQDANECLASLDINIQIIDHVAGTNVQDLSCFESQDGSIELSVLSAGIPLIFEWSGPDGFSATTRNINGLAAGIYRVKITHRNGDCYGTVSTEVKQPSEIEIDFDILSEACAGEVDGCLKVSGGTPDYKVWVFTCDTGVDISDPIFDNSGIPSVYGMDLTDVVPFEPTSVGDYTRCARDIPVGVYYVLIVDANACYAWEKIEIKLSNTLSLEIEKRDASCNGNMDGVACYKVIGGTAPYQISIVPNTPIVPYTDEAGCFKGLGAGVYRLTVVDANNCSYTARVEIKEATKIEVDFRITTEACAGEIDGCLKISGGTPGYKVWVYTCPSVLPVLPDPIFTGISSVPVVEGMDYDADVAFLSNDPTTPDPTRCAQDIPAGVYYVLVVDANRCWEWTKIEIPTGEGLEIKSQVKHVSCFGGNDGAIDISVINGTAPYTYEWSNGETTEDIDGLVAGDYKVLVKDANGCIGHVTIEVCEASKIEIDFDIKSEVCEGQVDGCLTISGGTPNYKVWVFTCEPGINVTDPIFNGSEVPSVNGMNLTDVITFDSTSDSDTIRCARDIPAGVYYVLVVDANGCWEWTKFEISNAGGLEIKSQVKHVSCFGGNDGAIDISVINGTAPYTYEWSNGETTEDIDGLVAGDYKVLVKDANGCIGRVTIEVCEASKIEIDFDIKSEVCADQVDGCLTIRGGTPDYKVWVYTCPSILPALPSPILTNANGAPVVDGMILTDVITFDSTSDSDTIRCARDIPAGVYYVLVVDSNDCWEWKKIEISTGGGLEIKSEIKHVSCFGGNDGAIDIKVVNGTAPYSYEWSNGETTEDIDGLVAGEYKVLVKDANGCLGRAIFTVRQPSKIEVDFRITSEACAGQVDGCLKISGGTPAYKVWVYSCPVPITTLPDPIFTNAGTEPVAEGMDYDADVVFLSNDPTDPDYTSCARDIPAGVYYVLVVDANGCWEWTKIEIPNSTGIIIKGEVTHVSCGSQDNGAIDIEVTGGNPPYSYSWSNGATTQDISGLAPGEYTVKVYTENHLCTATATFVVKEFGNIMLNCRFDPYGEFACVSPEGGTEPYTVQWFDLVTGLEVPHDDENCIYDLEPGSYYVKVTDANGCMSTEIFIVEPKSCSGGEAIVDPKEIKSGESTVFTLVNWNGQSIQWQFMTEYTDWVNVPEGTTEVFVTPPIHVGTSKWIKVRAVVTCWDGTIVYSTVTRFYVIGSDGTGLVEIESESSSVVDRKMFEVTKLPAGYTTQDISVYPTISTGRVTVRFDEVTGDLTTVKIMDLSGQVKEAIDAGTPSVGSTKEINLSNYAPGMYLITVETAGKKTTKRVVLGK